ncbi:MAG: VOC family protein [Acidobacteriia bacterium]|nr:VOC family protein [Terriglobia bacterium]
MAHLDKHAPGSFCWIELATPDQKAAQQFYQPLFGWEVVDFPMGPDQFYTMFRLEDRDTAGAYGMNAQMLEQHLPPHWMIYVAVTSADEAAAKVAEGGGKVVVAPFDVQDFGRMAVLQDPTGAVFSVWQAIEKTGIGIAGVPGTLCWADLSTPDQETAAAFYSMLFGWEVTPGEHDTSGYLHIRNGEQFIGGIPPSAHRNPNAPPHWMLYFVAQDCDASAAKAKDLGATLYMGPMAMEGVGRMAVVGDPQGAVFALFQAKAH